MAKNEEIIKDHTGDAIGAVDGNGVKYDTRI